MYTIMDSITSILYALKQHIQKTFIFPANIEKNISISLTTDAKKQNFGDISTNAALLIAPHVKKQPREVAQELIEAFAHPGIAKSEVAGPGFVNFTLTPRFYIQTAQEILTNPALIFEPKVNDPQTYCVEYVSANPTGPLHLGHGRGAIMGDVLSRVLKQTGNTVTREFYVNDAGSQINKLGNSFKIRCQQALGKNVELPKDAYHGSYLSHLAQTILSEQKANVEKAIATDNIAFFTTYAKDYLLNKIKHTLSSYGVEFDVWFSEKVLHIQGAIDQAIEQLAEANYTYTKDGAIWFKSTAFGDDKDRVLKRSNGELTYFAADIAYIKNKKDRGFKQLVMFLGQDHHGYVGRLKAAAQAFDYKADDLDIIIYQLVTIQEDGEALKLSKRAGRIVSLEDIINTVGTDVARFFYLNRKGEAQLDFNLNLALKKTEENPVFYIQYAYVRAHSIFEKAQEHPSFTNFSSKDIHTLDEQERLILKNILSLRSLLLDISSNYQTHLISYYTLELAHLFHSYYGSHKVLDENDITQTKHRLAFLSLMKQTFEFCLKILGINILEKM